MNLQVEKNDHLRHLLLFEFNRGSTAAQASRNINKVYGKNFIAGRTSRKWFARFKSNIFSLDDAPRAGRPIDFDDQRLLAILKEDNCQTTREISEQMNCDQKTVLNHLHILGKVQKLGAWIPRDLSQKNKDDRVTVCASLLARYEISVRQHRPFLSLLITGDEKWCLYTNIKRRRQWLDKKDLPSPCAKQNLHPLKILLSVWWNMDGIIHWELLDRNATITADVYCQQLRRLSKAIDLKGTNTSCQVVLQHDNARPHSAKLTKMVIQELGWEVLPHPPYSPDLAPSDYHLFRALSNNLSGKSFDDEQELRDWLTKWFDSRDEGFFRRGIQKLVNRWEQVIMNDGNYIID